MMIPDNHKSRLTNSTIFFVIALASLAYWIVDRYSEYISTYNLNDLLDGPLMIISLVVVWVYSGGVLKGFHDRTTQIYIFKAGITLSWISIGTWRLSRFLYAEGVFGKASIGVHDSWRGYMITLGIVAGILHIIAVDMDDVTGTFSRRYAYLAGGAVITGISFVFLFKIFVSQTIPLPWVSSYLLW